MITKLSRTITPLLWRVVVFLCLFFVISMASGPRIISGGIVFSAGFAIYGGIGKAIIFGLIAFVLLARHSKAEITLKAWHPGLLGWMLAGGMAFVASSMGIDRLLVDQRQFPNLAIAHVGLLLSIVCAAVGCFGPTNIVLVWQGYKRQIMNSIGLAAAFYVFLQGVYALWQPLASIVLASVHFLLGLSGLESTVVLPHTLLFDKFGITVAEYCSGIESIALFTSLYAIVGLLDWQRLRKKRFLMVFPLALLILFGLNILRVYGLILAGYYINPQIAFSLFHTYAGMVFFMAYSAVFWIVAYKHLVMPQTQDRKVEKP